MARSSSRWWSGEDRARLGYLLAGIYSVVAIAVHFAGGRYLTLPDDLTRHDDQATGNPSPSLTKRYVETEPASIEKAANLDHVDLLAGFLSLAARL